MRKKREGKGYVLDVKDEGAEYHPLEDVRQEYETQRNKSHCLLQWE